MLRTMFCVTFSAFCFLYGMFIFSIHDGTKFFLIWFIFGILLLLPIFLKKLNISERIIKPVRYIVIGVLTIIIGIFLIVEMCVIGGFKSSGKNDLDYIIVLGSQILEDGQPSVILLTRLERALNYLNENTNTVCIVTGGKGANEPYPEAYSMKKYLLDNGINESRIIIESTSSNTSENIANSFRLVDLTNSSVGIVTNNFHVHRAIKIANKHKIEKTFGIPCKTPSLFLANNMLREFFGILKDKFFGNM